MAKTMVFVVSEEGDGAEQVKTYCSSQGFQCLTYSHVQWREGMENPGFRTQLLTGVPHLGSGNLRTNVLPFPGLTPNLGVIPESARGTSTMEEMESRAIESAINQYRGNLTEAAKALGIGRATLYRKVKQYQIDPAHARKKRVA